MGLQKFGEVVYKVRRTGFLVIIFLSSVFAFQNCSEDLPARAILDQASTSSNGAPATPSTTVPGAATDQGGGSTNPAAQPTPTPTPAPQTPSIVATQTFVFVGSTVAVNVSGGPGNPTDWVALYASGNTGVNEQDWKYLNDSQTAPTTGSSSGTVTFVILNPGLYYFVFYASKSYNVLAQSQEVNVQYQF